MLNQQIGGACHQLLWIDALLRQRALGIEERTDLRRPLPCGHRTGRQSIEQISDPVDQIVPEGAELVAGQIDRHITILTQPTVVHGLSLQRSPSKMSCSRLRPPLTRLKTR